MRINQQWLEKRRQELSVAEQMQIESQLRRQESQREQREFMERVEQRRRAVERGEPLAVTLPPTMGEIFQAKRQEELEERARLEAERVAAMTPRDILFSQLDYGQRVAIQKWEAINGQPWNFYPGGTQ